MIRYYYINYFADAVDRGLLAGSVAASTEVLTELAKKGWLSSLPASSRHAEMVWAVTAEGRAEIMRLTGGRG